MFLFVYSIIYYIINMIIYNHTLKILQFINVSYLALYRLICIMCEIIGALGRIIRRHTYTHAYIFIYTHIYIYLYIHIFMRR